MSRRSLAGAGMLGDIMRSRTAYIAIWDEEDHESLQIFALEEGRTYKEQASFLLHRAIREEVERRGTLEPEAQSEAVA